jgi:nicotinate-nucleotide adenylyltransferase
MNRKKRIGILGGMFNPPHIGHLALAEEAAYQLKLDKVIFIPSFIPPHKSLKRDNPQLRYQMAALACKGNPLFEACGIELERNAVSYSVDTLRSLRRKYGSSADFFFIIGSDWIEELDEWKDSRELMRLAHFAVAKRPGFPMHGIKKSTRIIDMPLLDISSSMIRARIRKSQSVKYLVPEEVRRFIKKHRLYEAPRT